uniref:Uncharacterized protein n=1 Tax=Leersia perrieri TaxID=77586 RepID=A0A0D9VUQ1_9ORYZ
MQKAESRVAGPMESNEYSMSKSTASRRNRELIKLKRKVGLVSCRFGGYALRGNFPCRNEENKERIF